MQVVHGRWMVRVLHMTYHLLCEMVHATLFVAVFGSGVSQAIMDIWTMALSTFGQGLLAGMVMLAWIRAQILLST